MALLLFACAEGSEGIGNPTPFTGERRWDSEAASREVTACGGARSASGSFWLQLSAGRRLSPTGRLFEAASLARCSAPFRIAAPSTRGGPPLRPCASRGSPGGRIHILPTVSAIRRCVGYRSHSRIPGPAVLRRPPPPRSQCSPEQTGHKGQVGPGGESGELHGAGLGRLNRERVQVPGGDDAGNAIDSVY